MSIFYAIALCVVFVAFIAVTVEAVWSVSKEKTWALPASRLSLVETQDRRVNDLRYLGPERRAGKLAQRSAAAAPERLAA